MTSYDSRLKNWAQHSASMANLRQGGGLLGLLYIFLFSGLRYISFQVSRIKIIFSLHNIFQVKMNILFCVLIMQEVSHFSVLCVQYPLTLVGRREEGRKIRPL